MGGDSGNLRGLGTLAVILVVAVIGYWAGRDVRAQSADLVLDSAEGEVATLPA